MKIKKIAILLTILTFGVLSACSNIDGERIDDSNKLIDEAVQNEDIQEEEQVSESISELTEEAKADNRPVFVAHRGYSAIAPDNSMASFQAASDLGADMIELDVQMTSDGYIIVYHDLNLENTTGETGAASEYSYEELMQYRINEKYETQTGRLTVAGYEGYSNEKIPTLNQVMRFARDNGIGVNIEIKSISDVTEYTDEEISWFLNEIVSIVEENEMANSTIFSSFNYNYICEIEAMNSEYVTLFLTNVLNMEAFEGDFVADGIAIFYGCLESDTIERMHNIDKLVYIWTVDNLEMLKTVADMGVDGVITNNVGMIEYYY